MQSVPKTPLLAVDVIIKIKEGVLLIKRKYHPIGWAIPGGFVDIGETIETAIIREAKEETCLDIDNLKQFHAYSSPDRDPRMHCVSVIFTATATGTPTAADDAKEIGIFTRDTLPDIIAFDHRQILEDYFDGKY